MALNKAKLKSDIKQAFIHAKAEESDPEATFDALAGEISDAVDEFVKGLQIIYTQTALVAGPYSVTGTFNYELS